MPTHKHSNICRIVSNALSSIACLALSITVASASVTDDSEALLKEQIRIYCGSLIDGISNHPLGSHTITIKNGIIISISENLPESTVSLDPVSYTHLTLPTIYSV